MIFGAESTNLTVVRVKRDILRRSSVGGLFTNRSVSVVGPGSNQVYGADATFAFYDDVSLISYIARTYTPSLVGKDASCQGQFTYSGDRHGFQGEHRELFVVYTEEQNTDPLRPDRYTELRNRGLVVEVNRLFRF